MLEIFITDLCAYNNGFLIGKWITLPLGNQELAYAIWEVLQEGEYAYNSDSNHEEIFITDYSWKGSSVMEVGEYDNVFDLNDDITKLSELSETQQKAVAFLLGEQFTYDMEDAIQRSDDVIIHENQTLEDVAYELLQECYEVDKLPPIIANHIDYEGVAKELDYDGTYFEVDGDVFEYCG
jgi:hypothetical protein